MLHHQRAHVLLRLGGHAVEQGGFVLGAQLERQLMRQIGDDVETNAGERCMHVTLRVVAHAAAVEPPSARQQHDGDERCGAQRHHQRAQHASHEHGQAIQRREAQRVGGKPLQIAEHHDVHADGGQPLQPRLRRGHVARDDAHRDGQCQIAQAGGQGVRTAAALLPDEARHLLRGQQQRDHHPAVQKCQPDA
ncbi:hypothetical protein SDC9_75483 [bioreactor metagenome]|uniref:Uncharacterized protein n=1 Tax=bioreactor metagenome TaxID=1076179 RepID=A0A644YK37_9ZZZZ